MSGRPDISDADVHAIQIIAATLIAGVLTFAPIAIVVGQVGGAVRGAAGSLVSLVMAGFAAIAIVAVAILPSLVGTSSHASASSNPLNLYRSRTILRYALCEGAAFANLVAYLVEHNWWSLAIAGGLVFIMLTMFPTRTRMEHWVETRQMWNPVDEYSHE